MFLGTRLTSAVFKMADARKGNKRKRSKAFYAGVKRKRGQEILSPGMKGVLITCNERENRCVAEAYNLLNEYVDRLYGPEQKGAEDDTQQDKKEEDSEEEDESVEKALAREVKEMKESKESCKRRFQSVLSGVNNVVFIKTNLFENKDPTELVCSILTDIAKTGCKKTRHCLRFMPVAGTCYAKMDEITQLAQQLLHPFFFGVDVNPSKFCVSFKARYNSQIKRDDVISTLAGLVMQDGSGHTVDLKLPDLTVCVEIIKNVCCMSVLKDFFELKRYNIHEVTEKSHKPDTEKKQALDDTTEEKRESKNSGQSDTEEVKSECLSSAVCSAKELSKTAVMDECKESPFIAEKKVPEPPEIAT